MLMIYLFAVSFFVLCPTGVGLLAVVHQRLIKSYGYGVYFRYGPLKLYGSLLSPHERVMFGLGWGLAITPILALLVMLLAGYAR